MSKLICIEGPDSVGKSTITREVSGRLFVSTPDLWIFSHEPTFDSKTADELNFLKGDPWQREFYFMKDRLDHQAFLNKNDVVLDRYSLTGIVYAEVFSTPVVHDMCRSIYVLPEFKKPDIVFLLRMDPKDLVRLNESRKGTDEYNPDYNVNIATQLQKSFTRNLDFLEHTNTKYEIVDCEIGKIDEISEYITNTTINFYYGENNEVERLQTNKEDTILHEENDINK